MPKQTIETDYLVVGCGAAGMAFADSLIDASGAEIVMVDRRHAPGGHWLEAYPFVRLHQPSAFYGVNSLPLGSETIDRHGPNAGFYERAGAAEICGYYDRVMRERLLPSGRVRYFPMSSYLGEHRFVSTVSGEEVEVKVRKKLVDATYLEGRVPASSPLKRNAQIQLAIDLDRNPESGVLVVLTHSPGVGLEGREEDPPMPAADVLYGHLEGTVPGRCRRRLDHQVHSPGRLGPRLIGRGGPRAIKRRLQGVAKTLKANHLVENGTRLG